MVRHPVKDGYYRARVLQLDEASQQVELQIDYGEISGLPFMLPISSPRLWKGSYRNDHWHKLKGVRPQQLQTVLQAYVTPAWHLHGERKYSILRCRSWRL